MPLQKYTLPKQWARSEARGGRVHAGTKENPIPRVIVSLRRLIADNEAMARQRGDRSVGIRQAPLSEWRAGFHIFAHEDSIYQGDHLTEIAVWMHHSTCRARLYPAEADGMIDEHLDCCEDCHAYAQVYSAPHQTYPRHDSRRLPIATLLTLVWAVSRWWPAGAVWIWGASLVLSLIVLRRRGTRSRAILV